jgi:hypothetical protein
MLSIPKLRGPSLAMLKWGQWLELTHLTVVPWMMVIVAGSRPPARLYPISTVGHTGVGAGVVDTGWDVAGTGVILTAMVEVTVVPTGVALAVVEVGGTTPGVTVAVALAVGGVAAGVLESAIIVVLAQPKEESTRIKTRAMTVNLDFISCLPCI